MASSYDLIIVGAGHNGLVTAAYAARAGLRVCVVERREVVGGACVTEEPWPGFKVSTAAYVNSLMRPEIIRDLELKRFGFELLPRNPSSFTPFPDGRHLLLGPDAAMNRSQISKFSSHDADAYPRYEAMLERIADFIEPTLMQTPPNPWSFKPRDLLALGKMGWEFRRLGRDAVRAIDVLTGDAKSVLDRWFESDQLKAVLATDAVIGAMAAPSMAGTAYVLFHHVMGETDGARGVWAYVLGGMGGLTRALAASARAHGAEVLLNSPVSHVAIRQGTAYGVVLEDGKELNATRIASNADANVTFLKLVGEQHLPDDFVDEVKHIDYSSASLKMNVALSELPDFSALRGTTAGPQHRGTIHISPTMEYIERAFDDAKYGRPSERPMLECTIPSVLDNTLAPPGQYVMSMFIQYAPYALREGGWDDMKEKFADRCFDVLEEYAPNIKKAVIHRQILTPVDLEQRFALTGGNIMQGTMSLRSLFFLRPVAGYADYRTPIRNLYICGAAAHPGGGVMGAAGYNAAREILRDAGKLSRSVID